MAFRYFSIPSRYPDVAAEELNRFLAQSRVVAVRQELITAAEPHWAVCVEYVLGEQPRNGADSGQKTKRIDYRDYFDEPDFQRFAQLRSLRKRLAAEAGVPPYNVLSDAQLATLIEERISSRAQMQAIAGVGKAKMDKWSAAFLLELNALFAPDDGSDDGGDAQADAHSPSVDTP